MVPHLPHFIVAFLPLNRETMISQAKTCDVQDPVCGNVKAETKVIRPRVPAITKVWKETRENPDLPASTDSVHTLSRAFSWGTRKAWMPCPAPRWLHPLLVTTFVILIMVPLSVSASLLSLVRRWLLRVLKFYDKVQYKTSR